MGCSHVGLSRLGPIRSNDYLMGTTPNAADLTIAPFVGLGCLNAENFEEGSIQHFFAQHFRLSADRPRTAAWVERVMSHDR